MNYLSLVISLLAAIFAGLACWAAHMQANIAKDMKEIAIVGQKENFQRWLAANKPWLRITFPDQQGLHSKKKNMGPILIRIENYGKLPCKILSFMQDSNKIGGNLMSSSTTTDPISGFLHGARLAPGEAQIYKSHDINNLARSITKTRVNIQIGFQYGPDIIESYELSLAGEISSKREYTDLVPIESTGDL